MFSALLVIMVIAITDLGLLKGWLLKPLSKVVVAFLYFYFFFANFLVLMQLGVKRVVACAHHL